MFKIVFHRNLRSEKSGKILKFRVPILPGENKSGLINFSPNPKFSDRIPNLHVCVVY